MKALIRSTLLVALGALLALAIPAASHTPCGDGNYEYKPIEICGWQQIYNPHTGNRESVYVCD